jgi:hypothetical protein
VVTDRSWITEGRPGSDSEVIPTAGVQKYVRAGGTGTPIGHQPQDQPQGSEPRRYGIAGSEGSC